MMKIGKVVLIASIAMLMVVQSACVGVTDPATGETVTKFAPAEAVKNALVAVKELPDETKATMVEAFGWLLGCLGVGAVGTPVCSRVAAYLRNRKKTQIVCDKENGDLVNTNDVV